jgi:hypothetical protein
MNESARRGEQHQASAAANLHPLDQIMFSPLVSKVNPFHLADFADHCDCFFWSLDDA